MQFHTLSSEGLGDYSRADGIASRVTEVVQWHSLVGIVTDTDLIGAAKTP